MTLPNTEEREDILRTAHNWRNRMSQHDVGLKERADFELWLNADPQHAELYDRAVTFFQATGTLGAEDLGEDVLRKTPGEHWYLVRTQLGRLFRQRSFAAAMAATGVLCLAVVTPSVLSELFDQSPPTSAAVLARHATGIGEIREVTLSDGTVVTLGAASAIETSFTEDSRGAALTAGSALFDVSRDPDRPFTVRAGELEAQVLGTVFDVTRSADLVRVSVAEGRVAVSYPIVTDAYVTSKRSVQDVVAGQQIAARPSDGLGEKETVRIAAVGAWRDEKLYYKGARLSELVADANRYSQARVVIDDDDGAIGNFLVQGSFSTTDIDGMLSVLSEVYPVEIDRSEPDTIRITPAVASSP